MLSDIIIFLFEIERKKAKPVVKSAHTGRAQRSVVLVGHLDLDGGAQEVLVLQALFGDLVFLLHVLPLISVLAEKFLFFYAKVVLLLLLDLEGVQDNFISHSLL